MRDALPASDRAIRQPAGAALDDAIVPEKRKPGLPLGKPAPAIASVTRQIPAAPLAR